MDADERLMEEEEKYPIVLGYCWWTRGERLVKAKERLEVDNNGLQKRNGNW